MLINYIFLKSEDSRLTKILSVAVFFPEKIPTKQLIKKIPEIRDIVNTEAIQSICIASNKKNVTDMGTFAVRKALYNGGITSKNLNQLVFISEGISDYLYMDTSKTIIRNLNEEADGPIHANDYFRGQNGTLGFLEMISNQVESNPDIKYSVICSSLIWKYHSNHRVIGNTILGDEAGAILLSKDSTDNRNEILSFSSISLSQYNMLCGFKYGGTEYDITKEVIEKDLFKLDLLDKKQFLEFEKIVVKSCIEVINDVLEKAQVPITDIDYLGISGTETDKIKKIIDLFSEKTKIINSLKTKGYLGSLGSIDVLDSFINDDSIPYGSIMLVVSFGIDPNVEALIIRK